jgi:hypothetical protein
MRSSVIGMGSIGRFLFIILILLLVFSNVFWAYVYFMSIQCRNDALSEGSTTLAIILAHASALLKDAGRGQTEYLEVVYMLIDHALLVAQTLNKISDSDGWTRVVVSAIASLHDLLASMHQGYNVSKNKLIEIGDTLGKLAQALRNLDIESIEQYSQKLETLAYTT